MSIPYRLVGSYEYAKAMEAFTRLLSISKFEELPAYDNILNNRPEFTYFNGANAAFVSRPNLKQVSPFQRKQFYDTFQRQGLAWMMALARVELGATMSMYGTSDAPFHAISTSDFDKEAYVQVLADDAVAHMKSLGQEAGFNLVTRRGRPIDTWTLAYLRRLKLIRDMLASLQAIGNAEIRLRIAPYDTQLAKFEKRLMKEVYSQTRPEWKTDTAVNTERRSERSTSVSSQSIAECRELINNSKGGSGSTGSSSPRNVTTLR